MTEFPFRVRLADRLPVYGGRVGTATRRTLMTGALVVHLDDAGANGMWEGNVPTAWATEGEWELLDDEMASGSEGDDE